MNAQAATTRRQHNQAIQPRLNITNDDVQIVVELNTMNEKLSKHLQTDPFIKDSWA